MPRTLKRICLGLANTIATDVLNYWIWVRDLSVRNQSEMKDSNIRQIIRTVLQQGPVSRSELCRLTGLTPPAVSGLTKILLEDGILTELGPVNGKREGAGGRRAS